jgi:hypothetical protein
VGQGKGEEGKRAGDLGVPGSTPRGVPPEMADAGFRHSSFDTAMS